MFCELWRATLSWCAMVFEIMCQIGMYFSIASQQVVIVSSWCDACCTVWLCCEIIVTLVVGTMIVHLMDVYLIHLIHFLNLPTACITQNVNAPGKYFSLKWHSSSRNPRSIIPTADTFPVSNWRSISLIPWFVLPRQAEFAYSMWIQVTLMTTWFSAFISPGCIYLITRGVVVRDFIPLDLIEISDRRVLIRIIVSAFCCFALHCWVFRFKERPSPCCALVFPRVMIWSIQANPRQCSCGQVSLRCMPSSGSSLTIESFLPWSTN